MTNLVTVPPQRRKLARRLALLLLAYAIIGFFILPPIIRAVAVKQLSRQFDREVSIEKVKLNPFALSTTIRGLLIKDKDGQPFVSWDRVYVNFQLSSFFGHAWVFKEVSTTNPFVRVQINPNRSLNFSDLIAKLSTGPPSKEPSQTPAKPLALRIRRLHIAGATASLSDLTTRTPFRRTLGPLNVNLDNFRTDPLNKNPHSFSGTTDAGEKFSWTGHFYLDPLRSQGEFSLEDLSLNKYAALYQDLFRFEIKDGVVDLRAGYRLEFSAARHVAAVTNAAFALRSFQLAEPGNETNLVELREFSVAGASLDVNARCAEVASVAVAGARLSLRRDSNATINVVEISKPADTATNVPGGIMLLLRSITNAVALLLDSTNAWAATLHEMRFRDCAVTLEDLAHSRPARLELDDITLTARNISNLQGTNLTASLALRWGTNGSVKSDLTASLHPPAADIHVVLNQLDLHPLDPCLEPALHVLIRGSKLGLDGHVRLRSTDAGVPAISFQGDGWLDDFSTADAVLGEELLKWSSLRASGIDANLNPPAVAIKEIALNDLSARLVIETNRTVNLMAALGRSGTTAPVAADSKAAAGSETGAPATQPVASASEHEADASASEAGRTGLPAISIATIAVSNAQLHFTDRSLVPNVDLSIQHAGGTITGLSSTERQPAEVNLHAKVDNVGPVEITGTINPFARDKTNALKIAVQDVDLTPASPYAGKYAGYRIARGKLNLALAYQVQGRNLKSENLITLDQFTFGDRVDSPDATKLPVRLGVAILKDRNGKIELDVPVEGSLDDPEFRVRRVIGRAILNILTKAATSPFSLLGALLGGKGEEVRFQNFGPGSYELPPPGREKLDALTKALYERPALQLEIEGSIDPQADLDGLRQVALEKLLRAAKWESLRKSARASIAPDQVTLEPDERTAFLRQLYNEALSKGRIVSTTAKATTTTQSARAGSTVAAPAGSTPARGGDRGATALVDKPGTAVARPAAPTTNASKRIVTGDPIELALRNSLVIGDSDFAALAADRARAVREYLLQTGKVEADRLFLTETQPGGVKTQGSRAYLQLR